MTDWIPTQIPEQTAVRVRAGVLTRIRRRRQVRRASGAAAVLAAIALAFWPVPEPPESITLLAPKPPAAPAWKPLAAKPPVIMAKAPSRPAERITIYTSDPDVVIVLVADGGQE